MEDWFTKWHWKTISQFCHIFKKCFLMLFLFVTFFLWFRYGMKWLPVIIFLYVFLFVHQCSFKCPRRRLNKPKRRQKFDVSFLAGFCQEVFSIKYISFQAWKTMSRWWYGAGDTLALLHSQQLAIQGLSSVRPSHLDQDARHWCRWRFQEDQNSLCCFNGVIQLLGRFWRWRETWRRIWSP